MHSASPCLFLQLQLHLQPDVVELLRGMRASIHSNLAILQYTHTTHTLHTRTLTHSLQASTSSIPLHHLTLIIPHTPCLRFRTITAFSATSLPPVSCSPPIIPSWTVSHPPFHRPASLELAISHGYLYSSAHNSATFLSRTQALDCQTARLSRNLTETFPCGPTTEPSPFLHALKVCAEDCQDKIWRKA